MNEEEKEKEQIFKELQAEIRAGLDAYERGECIPLEDVIAQLSSDRQLEWSSEAQICPQRRFRDEQVFYIASLFLGYIEPKREGNEGEAL